MRIPSLVLCPIVMLAACAAVCAGDLDIAAIRRRLAENDARLTDLAAKERARAYAEDSYSGGMLSVGRNAVVTVGGTVNTRAYSRNADISTGPIRVDYDGSLVENKGSGSGPYYPDPERPYVFNAWDGSIVVNNSNIPGSGFFANRARVRDFTISDAKLTVKVDVSEHFDAFVELDLHNTNDPSESGVAEAYWLRWKNIANSGFGIKVGLDALTFGEDAPIGELGSYAAGNGEGIAELSWVDRFGRDATHNFDSGYYNRLAAPLHNNWDEKRFVQVTPYWESADGRLGAELSLYQDYGWHAQANADRRGSDHAMGDSLYHSGAGLRGKNDGLGSASLRLRWRPVEGLLLSASAANFHDRSAGARWGHVKGYREDSNGNYYEAYTTDERVGTKDNTAVGFAFEYRPAFFSRLNLWGQWIRGWNVDNIKDLDSVAANVGVSFDVTERLTFFAQGDWMRSRGYARAFGTPSNDAYYASSFSTDFDFSTYRYAGYDKAAAWASYVGARYSFPCGVSLEIGWKHEEITWKNGKSFQVFKRNHPDNPAGHPAGYHKIKNTRLQGDTIYAHLGMVF